MTASLGSLRALALTLLSLVTVSTASCGSTSAPAPTKEGPVALSAAPVAPLPAAVHAPTFAPPEWQRAPGPPLTLTASDGSGLTLARLSARAVVAEPLAFTELRLAFENPSDRVIEGTFSITLPPRASIARFAMRTGDEWQEGEVVERQAARRAYEDFLHRKQDPALLEQAAGNQFSARVFPIAARGQKELIVSYAEELPGGAPYALALKGLADVGELDVSVAGDGAEAQTYHSSKATPEGDLVFDRRAAAPWDGVRSGAMVALRVRPEGQSEAAPDPINGVLVLVDTSGSRALGYHDEVKLVRDIVGRIASKDPSAAVWVACYDQTIQQVFDGTASAFGDREVAAMEERGALGASNLEQALAWARFHATEGTPVHRVVLVTDGVATAGATDAVPLRADATALRGVGIERLDVVAVGGIRDEPALRELVTAGLPRDGVLVDGGLGADAIAAKLGARTRSGIAVHIPQASFVYPAKLDGIQPGDEAVVYADVGDAREVTVSFNDGPQTAVRFGGADAPLLGRALAQAHISQLLDRETTEGKAPELEKAIVDLAVGYRIVTPYTALLVLETDADFARYDISRRGLADILTVEGGMLLSSSRKERTHKPLQAAAPVPPSPENARHAPSKAAAAARAPGAAGAPAAAPGAASQAATGTEERNAPLLAAPPPPPPSEGPESRGLGSIGATAPAPVPEPSPPSVPMPPTPMATMAAPSMAPPPAMADGLGLAAPGAGFGNGHGRMSAIAGTPHVAVRSEPPTVSGGTVPLEVIERIVRQNFGRFRLCYETGLRQNPALSGRVSVRFVIDRSGGVATATNAGSLLADTAVVSCIVRGFNNLSFPEPQGGPATVVLPLILSLSSQGESPPFPPSPDVAQPIKPAASDPYTGKLHDVMALLLNKDVKGARGVAQAWHDADVGDILALVALGESLEAGHDFERAARAYGSLIDLFPARADMRRFAGSRLERVKGGDPLALDSYEKAVAQRPDHPSSHRMLTYALLKSGAAEKAFEAAVTGLKREYPSTRFPGVHQILQEDVGLIAAAWAKAEPARRGEIDKRVKEAGGTVEDAPSIRFVLTWETDANDVDFHIYDAAGGHAFYQHKHLPSGGDLYADITTGYGPECFTIRGPKEARSPLYTLQANYYSRGPMGYGMGKLEVVEHDGKGALKFDERPYVVMVDHAFVDLGVVKR